MLSWAHDSQTGTVHHVDHTQMARGVTLKAPLSPSPCASFHLVKVNKHSLTYFGPKRSCQLTVPGNSPVFRSSQGTQRVKAQIDLGKTLRVGWGCGTAEPWGSDCELQNPAVQTASEPCTLCVSSHWARSFGLERSVCLCLWAQPAACRKHEVNGTRRWLP